MFYLPCISVPFKVLELEKNFTKFYQIQGGSCTKIISLRWKLAKLSRKTISFTHFQKICGTNFPKCWANLVAYCRRENTAMRHYDIFCMDHET